MKMKDFAGVSEEDQYANTLPEGLGPMVKFPDWAYADELNKTQKKIAEQKEKEARQVQRGHIDFVPASAASASSSTNATPSGRGGTKGGGSAAERVMAGLDKDRDSGSSREREGGGARKTRFDSRDGRTREVERRGGRDEPRRSRFRSRSRSPRRR